MGVTLPCAGAGRLIDCSRISVGEIQVLLIEPHVVPVPSSRTPFAPEGQATGGALSTVETQLASTRASPPAYGTQLNASATVDNHSEEEEGNDEDEDEDDQDVEEEEQPDSELSFDDDEELAFEAALRTSAAAAAVRVRFHIIRSARI